MIGMFMVHTVTVRTYQGEGSYGPVYADPVEVSGVMVDETVRLVRAPDGSEATSTSTIRGRLPDADRFAVGSRVTLPSGDETTVLQKSRQANMPLLAVVAHFEAACE